MSSKCESVKSNLCRKAKNKHFNKAFLMAGNCAAWTFRLCTGVKRSLVTNIWVIGPKISCCMFSSYEVYWILSTFAGILLNCVPYGKEIMFFQSICGTVIRFVPFYFGFSWYFQCLLALNPKGWFCNEGLNYCRPNKATLINFTFKLHYLFFNYSKH